jgi:hypothetical protein
MNTLGMGPRLGLVVLAALLALPLAQTAPSLAAKQRTRTIIGTFSNAAPLNLPIGAV